MKCTLGELYTAFPVIQKIKEHQTSDIKTAYLLHRSMTVLTKEIEHLNTARNALFKKHGEDDPKVRGTVRVKEENMEAFVKEMDELMKTEIDINMNPVDISKLSGISLSAADFSAINKFVTVPDSWKSE